MNKNYQKGYRLERKIMNLYKKYNIFSTRTAGSHSPFDVIAISHNNLLLIQCKNRKGTKQDVEKLQEIRKKIPKELNVLILLYTSEADEVVESREIK